MVETSALLVILILAHVVLGFWISSHSILQPPFHFSRKVIISLLIAGVYFIVFSLLMVLLRDNDIFAWKAGLLMAVARFLTLILTPSASKSPTLVLLSGQAILVTSLVAVWLISENNAASLQVSLTKLITTPLLAVGLAYISMLRPASAMISTILSPWIKEIDNTGSLANAGTLIGYLERLLILTFVLLEQWEAVGFLLTAKSILRFNEIQNAKVRSISEYVLLGTLLSFSLSIGVGLLVTYILKSQ
ncbi:hypothetical protein LOY35_04690 [Pseudomonas sp. B21-028]|uniref:hypothetical protein n=1 Tax=Pseudomonas sp. B21-028 TaxID=2895480 RepID=UPI002160D2B4|nr:hypothetical protein [Pseudomonas sp. B21-028]UVL84891.1 hypothetical protein LOY35_04690 [Pseudomonas sp. B21-028]